MLYFAALAALALIGVSCAAAFRWPVVLGVSVLVAAAAMVATDWRDHDVVSGAAVAFACVLTLQASYVLTGLVWASRPRRVSSKKNLNA